QLGREELRCRVWRSRKRSGETDMPRIGSAGWLRVGAMCAALLICAAEAWGQGELAVKKPRCEWKVDPMGIDVAKPRFSWELESADKNVMQSGYELQVAGRRRNWRRG